MTHRITGMIAAALFGALWISFGLFIALIMPGFGITSPTSLTDPDVLLPAIYQHPPMLIFPGLDMLLGTTLIFLAVAIAGQAPNKVPAAYALPFGIAAGAFFILLATNRVITLPLLAGMHATNPADVTPLFALLNASHDGLTMAVRIALSFWLLVNSISVSGRGIAIALALCGLVNAIGLIIQPVSALNILLFPVLAGFLMRWFQKSPLPG